MDTTTDCNHYFLPTTGRANVDFKKSCIYCGKQYNAHSFVIPRLDKKGKPVR